jgi:PIN domain nuclease of toxin-antitoxin system
MKYLLDTAVWLWTLSEPQRIDHKARQLIAEGREELYLSAASSWEIKHQVGTGKATPAGVAWHLRAQTDRE